MLETLWDKAGGFADLLSILAAMTAAAAWVVRMLLASKKRVEALFQAVERIESEFRENGGHSMRDQISGVGNQIVSLASSIKKVEERQWAIIEGIREPMWESDEHGNCVRVNRAMLSLAGRHTEEFVGSNWENIVDKSDRERVYREWVDAVMRKRTFQSAYKIRRPDGAMFEVEATATPYRTDQGVVGWVGKYDTAREVKNAI